MNKKPQNKFIELVFLAIGMFTLAFAIAGVLKPNHLIMGGATGISIIIAKLINADYTIVNYVTALSILLATYLFLGKKEAQKIVMLSVLFPLVLIIVKRLGWKLIIDDTLLAAIYFGVIAGFGCGLIFRCGYSTGGTDSIGKILHIKVYPFISMSIIMTTIDMIILAISIFVYDVNTALYALVGQVVLLKTIDTVMFGFGNRLVKLEIVSKQNPAIEEFIIHQVKRGVSRLTAVGAFTGEERAKVVTVCTPRESLLIKQFIADLDQQAFVTILPVSSVWGIGQDFEPLNSED